MPATPYDVKGLRRTAIRDDNPIIFIEHKMLYKQEGPVPEGEYLIPPGVADIAREGKDVTIIACGIMVSEALSAAESLAQKGIQASVLNMHTIKPIDKESILKAAQETGAIVTAEEHQINGGLGSAVAEVLVRNNPVPQETSNNYILKIIDCQRSSL